jgi:hypothetical protein
MRYRSKPVEIEATQWFPGTDIPGVRMETPDQAYDEVEGREYSTKRIAREPRAYVITIHHEKAHLAPGDYVITEPDGVHHYPCKPGIFEKRYEPIP